LESEEVIPVRRRRVSEAGLSYLCEFFVENVEKFLVLSGRAIFVVLFTFTKDRLEL
jgi:hypothetical protein